MLVMRCISPETCNRNSKQSNQYSWCKPWTLNLWLKPYCVQKKKIGKKSNRKSAKNENICAFWANCKCACGLKGLLIFSSIGYFNNNGCVESSVRQNAYGYVKIAIARKQLAVHPEPQRYSKPNGSIQIDNKNEMHICECVKRANGSYSYQITSTKRQLNDNSEIILLTDRMKCTASIESFEQKPVWKVGGGVKTRSEKWRRWRRFKASMNLNIHMYTSYERLVNNSSTIMYETSEE